MDIGKENSTFNTNITRKELFMT